MIERIKEVVFTLYNAEEKKGCFISCFNQQKQLIISGGIVETDKPLRETIDDLYTKNIVNILGTINYIVVDIVTEVISFPAAEQVLQLDPKEYGFIVEDLEDENIAIMLPNITGVSESKQVLFNLKKKNAIHGKAAISGFKTERIVIAK